jgi:hypothetical protein
MACIKFWLYDRYTKNCCDLTALLSGSQNCVTTHNQLRNTDALPAMTTRTQIGGNTEKVVESSPTSATYVQPTTGCEAENETATRASSAMRCSKYWTHLSVGHNVGSSSRDRSSDVDAGSSSNVNGLQREICKTRDANSRRVRARLGPEQVKTVVLRSREHDLNRANGSPARHELRGRQRSAASTYAFFRQLMSK